MKTRGLQVSVTLILSALALYVALNGANFNNVGAALQQRTT